MYGLLKYLKNYKINLIIVLASLTFVSFSLLAIGYCFRKLVDEGLSLSCLKYINFYTLVICIMIILLGISSFLRSYFINCLNEKIIGDIKVDLYKSLMNLQIYYFEKTNSSNILSKFTTDIELISKFINDFLSFFIRNTLMLLGSFIMMLIQSYKLTLIIITIVPIISLPLIKLHNHIKVLSKKSRELQNNIDNFIEESIKNLYSLHIYNQQEKKVKVLKNLVFNSFDIIFTKLKARSVFFSLSISLILLSITFVVWIGSRDTAMGVISSGSMISFIYFAMIASASIVGFLELLSNIHKSIFSINEIMEFLSINIQPTYFIESKLEQTLQNDDDLIIEFDNITFSYPSKPNIVVLKDLSMKFKSNQLIGLVGKSGAGKSTIAHLLLKFYYPNKGKIYINGYDIFKLNTKEIRKIISYVPHEPQIFFNTIKFNITMGDLDISDEEIINISKITGLDKLINKLKCGFNTTIGDKGLKLSSGQKQYLTITRALLAKPKMLILDEATSSLDYNNERILLSALRDFMKHKNIVHISHNPSNIAILDTIFLVNEGCIILNGSHKRLIQESNLYKSLQKI